MPFCLSSLVKETAIASQPFVSKASVRFGFPGVKRLLRLNSMSTIGALSVEP